MTESKKSRFGVGLLIYAWILLMLCGAALFFLHDYMRAYEDSQVKYELEVYRSALSETLPQAGSEALSGLDPEIQSPEENQRWALALLKGAVLVKQPALSTDERPVYQIRTADGQPVGSVAFGIVGQGPYRLPVWAPVEEVFDFSSFYQMAGVTVPPDYQVYLGERLLGAESVEDPQVPYDALEECYQHYDRLPTMLRYAGGPFVGQPVLRICDEAGRELTPDELTQEHFLNRCPAEARERVETMVEEFIPVYVYFSADVNGTAMLYYTKLNSMIVPESALQERMRFAIQSFGYSNTHALDILSVSVDSVSDLGEGRYLADVSYKTEITALRGAVVTEEHVRLVLMDLDGKLLADAVYHY